MLNIFSNFDDDSLFGDFTLLAEHEIQHGMQIAKQGMYNSDVSVDIGSNRFSLSAGDVDVQPAWRKMEVNHDNFRNDEDDMEPI